MATLTGDPRTFLDFFPLGVLKNNAVLVILLYQNDALKDESLDKQNCLYYLCIFFFFFFFYDFFFFEDSLLLYFF